MTTTETETFNPARFYSTDEIVSVLGVSKKTFQRMEAVGEGPPCRRLGRRRLYAGAALNAWVSRDRATGGHQSAA